MTKVTINGKDLYLNAEGKLQDELGRLVDGDGIPLPSGIPTGPQQATELVPNLEEQAEMPQPPAIPSSRPLTYNELADIADSDEKRALQPMTASQKAYLMEHSHRTEAEIAHLNLVTAEEMITADKASGRIGVHPNTIADLIKNWGFTPQELAGISADTADKFYKEMQRRRAIRTNGASLRKLRKVNEVF